MQRILSSQLPAYAGRTVTVAGWVHRRRVLKAVAFLIMRDRAGLVQIVITDPKVREQLERLTEETVVEVTGLVTINSAAPLGVELTQPVVRALSAAAAPPPFDLYRPLLTANLPTQLDHASVALRHATRRRAVTAAAAAAEGFRATLDERGFTEIFTPKIVASATESGANVFGIDYFGSQAFLAQSPQFYKQLMVGVFEQVYEVGPVFRAEPHDTARHLAQYTSLDVELGFIDDHRDVMAVLRDVVAGMTDAVSNRLPGVKMPVVPAEIPVVHFTTALEIAGAPDDEPDLAPAHERALGEWALREHGSDFLYVTGYPMRKRPFYTHPEPGRPTHSNSFDLLFRGLEMVTGGQRLHEHADYVAALKGDLTGVETYVEAFRHGMPPHGGFAIGLERFVARLLGATNVREVAVFPRDLHRLTP
ncbi:aspartate--tRNA(Asp/Asn) ligase [Asanoa ishikariensis]|uniref:Aspartate--tRNA(Asp/Asn) ligase n=1 Tax=Asanoa ishikariensis TaxID=137265 RepID=A0A1H3NZS9_9ACTN|nr:aspartate--tRNA(Asn) ligase [Asanoa ishikariensis]GIF68221.1 aspartate--tRNA(Asp/Asn) ligase [Asanoa ishikariensis]SDY94387.1 aspartyl-tRNA synthetase [Asanoa ishikariensis]